MWFQPIIIPPFDKQTDVSTDITIMELDSCRHFVIYIYITVLYCSI